MPMVPGKRRRADGQLFRAVAIEKDETRDAIRRTILDVGFTRDSIKEAVERNRNSDLLKGRVAIEVAVLPEDLEWKELPG